MICSIRICSSFGHVNSTLTLIGALTMPTFEFGIDGGLRRRERGFRVEDLYCHQETCVGEHLLLPRVFRLRLSEERG